MGVGPIRSSEYEAWARLNRVKIGVSELSILKTIDRAFVAYANEKDKPSSISEEQFAKNMRDLGDQLGTTKKG